MVTVILPNHVGSGDHNSESTPHGGTCESPSVTLGSGAWELPGPSLGIGCQNPLFPTVDLTSLHLCTEAERGNRDPDFLIHDSSLYLSPICGPQKGVGFPLYYVLLS